MYNWVAKGQDGVEVRSMIDLVLVKKDMLHNVQDVKGMGHGLTDQHVVVNGAMRIRSETFEYQ